MMQGEGHEMGRFLGFLRDEWESEFDKPPRVVMAREVCPTCDGTGTTWHGRPVSDAVAFTQSEWGELDDDDRHGYMSGRYDGVCPDCNGKNVIEVIDEQATDPKVTAMWNDWIKSAYETSYIEHQERMMGA